MNPKLYCFKCMSTLETEDGRCPHCGHDNRVRVNGSGCLPYSIVNKRYLIGKALGRGGFGVTYIGRDLSLDRRVAIKEYLPGELVNRTPGQSALAPYDESSRMSFERGRERSLEEARTIARLNDVPDAVNVYDVFIANNTLYIVMEYIKGETLAELTRRRGGRLPAGEALALLRPVFRALTLIHAQGIIHRDVSPDNIMFRAKTGRAVLLDFGAAHDYAGGGETEHSTSLRPGYAPVEQYSRYGRQDERTDEYALCATLYFAITGQKPVASMERAFGDVALTAPSALGADITPGMEAVLLKALSVNASDRYADIPALEAALDALPDLPMFHATAAGAQTNADGQTPKTRPEPKQAAPAAPRAEARAHAPRPQPGAEPEGDTYVIDPGAAAGPQAAPDVYERTSVAPETDETAADPETERASAADAAAGDAASGDRRPAPPEPPRARAGLEPKKRRKRYIRLLWIVALLAAIAAGVYFMTVPYRLANGSSAFFSGPAGTVSRAQWQVYETDRNSYGTYQVTYITKDGWLFTVDHYDRLVLEGPSPDKEKATTDVVEMPDTLYGWPVDVVSMNFSGVYYPNCESITKLVISNTVVNMTHEAFKQFDRLETVSGGKALRSIYLSECFNRNCPFYQWAIGQTLIWNDGLLVHALFDGDPRKIAKKTTGSVTVPEGITILNSGVFIRPNGVDGGQVTSVSLPSSLKIMAYHSMDHYAGTKLTIPDGVEVQAALFYYGETTVQDLWVGKNVKFAYGRPASAANLDGASFYGCDFSGTLHLVDGATLPTLVGLFGNDCKYTVDCQKGAILDGYTPRGVKMEYRK
ncbi:MAG: serine/threonine protein kinase [Clostridiales bacterium]|nr:serine/threonine protein kinase [Clostridiales bacterium]